MTKILNPKHFEHLNFDIASNFGIQISNFFYYLLILFLPTQLGRHFWPDFSLISGIRVDYLAPTLFLTDILILFLFIFWVFSKGKFSIFNSKLPLLSFRSASWRRGIPLGSLASPGARRYLASFEMTDRKNSFHPDRFGIKFQISLVAVIVLIGIVFSKNQLAGMYGFLKLLEFIFLGFYTACNIKRLNFGIVLLLFSVGIIFESFLAILQYFNQGSIGGIFYFFGERTFNSQTPGIANASVNGELILRPYATFSHPNVLAGYLTIAMAMVISNFNPFGKLRVDAERSRSIKFQISNVKKIVLAVSLVLGTLALFLTMSRMAILLWLLIIGLWFIKFSIFNSKLSLLSFRSASWRRGIPLGSLTSPGARRYLASFEMTDRKNSLIPLSGTNLKFKILILGVIGAILLISPLHSRFADLRLSDESIMQRGELIKDSFSMIKSNPVFGVGLNNFLVELPNVHKQDANIFYLQPVHNIYLLILAQTGIVGFTFFIWFMFKTFKNLSRQNRDKFQILLIVLILGLFDHYFLTLQQGQLLFSFILGLCWAKMPSYKSLH